MGDELIFELNAQVTVNGLPSTISGTVRGIWIDGNGAQFQVQYLDSKGAIQRDWFTATELTAAEPTI